MIEANRNTGLTEQWLGFGLDGVQLDDFLVQSSAQIKAGWRRVYHDARKRSLVLEDYQDATSMGYFAKEVIRTAILWNSDQDQEKQAVAHNILSHQFLKYTLSALNGLPEHDQDIDPLNVLHDGFTFAWSNWEDAGADTFSGTVNRYVHRNNRTPVEQSLAAADAKEKSTARFVAADMDEYVDPHEDVARSEFVRNVMDVIETFDPSEQIILKSRYIFPVERRLTFSEIAQELGSTNDIVRQKEARALRRIRTAISKREQFEGYGGNEEMSVEQKLRAYENGIINACQSQDGTRARHNLAMIKKILLEGEYVFEGRYRLYDAIIRLFEDPIYSQLSDDSIVRYLNHFTTDPDRVLSGIKKIETEENTIFPELSRYEKMVRKLD